MFAKIVFSVVSFLIVSQPVSAGILNLNLKGPKGTPVQICKREFANDLISCVVKTYFQKPKVRHANLKSCVQDAKTEKATCIAATQPPVDPGPSQCELACNANYDANVFTCQNTFDPSVCGGNVACESFYQQERANCISLEVDALNACTSSCQ